ncbi:hypothetical protein LX36DRAFT_719115 [Colletotrichum falcatum]|nr:hypothetical protein LX36DRAFT_719115 [Colletotrichum falcatum]
MGNPVDQSASKETPESLGFGQTVLLATAGPGAQTPVGDQPNTPLAPVLGELENHSFSGFGFNTIFRPNSTNKKIPTILNARGPNDNVLQLNLTKEEMKFEPRLSTLGEVPNRGLFQQADINLNGVPYSQKVFDMMNPEVATPLIHYENGMWLNVPESTKPKLNASLVRMASIPHGTTINAQTFSTPVLLDGGPDIKPNSITPFPVGKPKAPLTGVFPSLIAANKDTFRLPQDLTPLPKAQTITQEMIDNPNIVLQNANKGKKIINSTTYTVSTSLSEPNFGGGTSNIGFLQGDGSQGGNTEATDTTTKRANANAAKVTATYWISKVQAKLRLEPFKPSDEEPERTFSPVPVRPTDAVPVYTVKFEIPSAKEITVVYTQLQYSQTILLDFAGLSWPHVSVGTLAPIDLKLESSVLR